MSENGGSVEKFILYSFIMAGGAGNEIPCAEQQWALGASFGECGRVRFLLIFGVDGHWGSFFSLVKVHPPDVRIRHDVAPLLNLDEDVFHKWMRIYIIMRVKTHNIHNMQNKFMYACMHKKPIIIFGDDNR